jgi:hypothetical protein
MTAAALRWHCTQIGRGQGSPPYLLSPPRTGGGRMLVHLPCGGPPSLWSEGGEIRVKPSTRYLILIHKIARVV